VGPIGGNDFVHDVIVFSGATPFDPVPSLSFWGLSSLVFFVFLQLNVSRPLITCCELRIAKTKIRWFIGPPAVVKWFSTFLQFNMTHLPYR